MPRAHGERLAGGHRAGLAGRDAGLAGRPPRHAPHPAHPQRLAAEHRQRDARRRREVGNGAPRRDPQIIDSYSEKKPVKIGQHTKIRNEEQSSEKVVERGHQFFSEVTTIFPVTLTVTRTVVDKNFTYN